MGVGSNLGDPEARVRGALRSLEAAGRVRASSLYRSEPLGDSAQPWYVNAVAELPWSGSARELLGWLRRLEEQAGRPAERPRLAPRVLDLDLLLLGQEVVREPDLVVPHPGLSRRRFVLVPLAELAPEARDPVSGLTAAQLLAALDDPLRVEKHAPEAREGGPEPVALDTAGPRREVFR